ncbi:MAG TPA: ATP-binding protein [Chthoniobacterales bacterium]|jgi:hypothetical protein
MDFFTKLFDTSDFPARWHCGNWSEFLGWLHILSDLAIFGAYAAIPLSIAYFVVVKRQEIVFPKLYWFFAAFILSCGLTHLIDATLFWHPWYRLAGLVKFITAVSSWATIILLFTTLPVALALPGTVRLNADLQREIEERKRSEAALRASTTRLRLAMEHSKLGDWSWNPADDHTALSARAHEILGVPLGREETWAQILRRLHPDDRQATNRAVQHAVEHQSDYDAEYRIRRETDGQEVWVSAKGRAEYDPEGKVTAMIGTVQDITQRKRLDAEREQLLAREQSARAEAERAGLMKDEFLATLSHELRTPLNAILGWAHLLREEDDPDQCRQGLAVIERNTRVQCQLVDDLLDMNRIITGKVRLEIQRVTLGDIVSAALDSVTPSATSRNLRFETDLDPNAPVIMGDPTRLQQIVWNLLTNAIKFSPAGGVINISLRSVDSDVEIAVTDHGQGIPPAFLPHVFDRFRQADSSTTRKHGGLGLGLAIVKNLAEMHGGTIAAESEGENRGTTFRLRLPTAPADVSAGPARPLSQHAGPPIAEGPANRWPGIRNSRILLVEDDPDSLALLVQVLERVGARVRTATSGVEALAVLDSATFDLIISDIGMPDMDGWTLAQTLRLRPAIQNGNIPAIALTAFARAEDQHRALAAGYNIFLVKPVQPGELLSVVNHYTTRVGTR